MSAVQWLNTAWMWKCGPALRDFQRSTRDVATTQAAVLRRIVRANRDCEFGRRSGFRAIRAARDFQGQVEPSTYDDYAAAVERIARGEQGVLTSERVTLLEPTSGTSRGEKLIPYTKSLRSEFQRTINAWVADLLRYRPAVRSGRSYWSISPAFTARQPTEGGIPIGFEDDTQYLGLFEQRLVNRMLAVPTSVAHASSVEAFRYSTLLHLAAASDLSLISIWSPTFLTTIVQSLESWGDRVCHDLEAGGVSMRDSTDQAAIGAMSVPRPRRAHEVRAILASSTSPAERLQQLWPRLAMISCWADAAAARQALQLQQLFPSVEIQRKGLLATECFVSFPLVSYDAPVLAIGSHFFEFQRLGDDGKQGDDFRLAHELDRGSRYTVLVTTGGGLYRYRLNDIVEVVGHANECPLVRFVGRADRSSDLVGEKLHEPFVRECVDEALAKHDLSPSFAMLVPVTSPQPHYRLYLQCDEREVNDLPARGLADDLARLLQRNPHYRYASELGQLQRLRVCAIPRGSKTAWEVFESTSADVACRIGDVKPTALDAWTGWANVFDELIAASSEGVRTV